MSPSELVARAKALLGQSEGIEPGSPQATKIGLATIAGLYAGSGRWSDAAECLGRAAELTSDPAERDGWLELARRASSLRTAPPRS